MKIKDFVLCVDDSELVREIIKSTLRKILPNSTEIITFDNYFSVLELIKKDINKIKFIVCDHSIQKMDGLQFINWLKTNNIDIPIVVLTGSSNSKIIDEYKECPNVKAVLNKPISKNTFKEKIRLATQWNKFGI
jgi:CheY-like chemotaxis protein